MKNIIILILSIVLSISSHAESMSLIPSKDRGLNISNKDKKIKNIEQRVALIVGNNDYSGSLSKLNNPINDAKSIKKILQQRGFEVIYAEDSTKRSIKTSLDKFYNAIKKGGVGMFYFSGHGIEVDGQNYLIPIDAKIEEKSDTEFEAIALNKITKRMQNIGNRLNIVVLDACRNDPFSRSIGVGGLAKVEPIGMFVSYSTGAGSVASDGKVGGNGLFTKSLIKYMQEELDLRDVFQQTRAEVYSKSNHKQFPAIYDQTINGEFYFTQPTSVKTNMLSVPMEDPKIKSTKTRTYKQTVKSASTQNGIAYRPRLIIDSRLDNILSISTESSRVTNDMIEIVLDIENHSSEKLSTHYKVKWLDNEGFEVAETLSIWQAIFIDAQDSKKLKEIAPIPTASSCKVYFK